MASVLMTQFAVAAMESSRRQASAVRVCVDTALSPKEDGEAGLPDLVDF